MGRQKIIAGLVALFGAVGIPGHGWAQTTNAGTDLDSCGTWPDMKQCYPNNVACSEAYLQRSVEIATCRTQKIAAAAAARPGTSGASTIGLPVAQAASSSMESKSPR